MSERSVAQAMKSTSSIFRASIQRNQKVIELKCRRNFSRIRRGPTLRSGPKIFQNFSEIE